jgi:hypothetical protein
MKKESPKKSSRRPLINKKDRRVIKESMQLVSLVLLISGFLFDEKSLVGIGILILIVFFMIRK